MNASTREEFSLKSEKQNSIPKAINKKGGIL
jgi:hypothetical protein